MDEFKLIERFFCGGGAPRGDVVVGVGDDAALLAVPSNRLLVAAIDTIIKGVHFPEQTPAEAIGHRVLAVNLSDLAAMGAEPAWALLSLTLPEINTTWLKAFAAGLYSLAKRTGTALVGGDITRGPLSATVSVHGLIEAGAELRRAGAKPHDRIYVTGTVGDAAAGLHRIQSGLLDPDDALVRRFYYPEPRISAGRALAGLASAAIDVSDGLLADLGHLAHAGGFSAYVETACLPLSDALQQTCDSQAAWQFALTGGDDYELCFTVSADKAGRAERSLAACGCAATCIGAIKTGCGVFLVDENGNTRQYDKAAGYRHFDSEA